MDPLTIGVLSRKRHRSASAARASAGLKAWNGWLDLKRMELTQVAGDRDLPPASGRIEMADLRERVRKLEAIAAGIDL